MFWKIFIFLKIGLKFLKANNANHYKKKQGGKDGGFKLTSDFHISLRSIFSIFFQIPYGPAQN